MRSFANYIFYFRAHARYWRLAKVLGEDKDFPVDANHQVQLNYLRDNEHYSDFRPLIDDLYRRYCKHLNIGHSYRS